jgi:general secretion pathway protein F
MAAFRYEALDATGRVVSGSLQADTPRHARTQLRAQGLLPSVLDPVGRPGLRARRRRIPSAELALVTRQMATLLESGLTLEQTLSALIEEAAQTPSRDVLAGVRAEVTAGLDLAGAIGVYPESFPDFYRALVQGGEQSGALPAVLAHLADYLEMRHAMKQKTALALLYPALVAAVALLIVAGLVMYVVPQVVQVFQQSRQALPLLTRGVIGLSDFLRTAWPYLAAFAIAGVVLGRMALRRPALERRWHALLLRTPGYGGLVRSADVARFASTLSILIGGGVPLLAALESGARVMTNAVLRSAVAEAAARVREGASLARALAAARVFPPLLVHLVASGEASGRLQRMLERAARLENQALERRLAVFLTLLEPAMILVMGAIVLLIVLAILMPIISMNQLVR